MDIFPPVKQRPALIELAKALGSRDSALRRDECGDWRITGRSGHIYAVPGSPGRPDTPGFQIFISASARWWTNSKGALDPFADLANDGDEEGAHFVFRLPTAAEAASIRHYVGLAKKAEYSDEVLAQKREQVLRGRLQIGQKRPRTTWLASCPPTGVKGKFKLSQRQP